MQNKWFNSWRGQDDSDSPANGTSLSPAAQSEAATDNRVASHPSGNGFAASGVELLAFDEIYRSAGIKGPRLGYTIGKVIEMLHSEHIKNLSAEMKRSSLLMALEAAGVQVDEVLQDATLRQRAINSYEAIQRKHLEEFEARKAQENCAIQAEADLFTEAALSGTVRARQVETIYTRYGGMMSVGGAAFLVGYILVVASAVWMGRGRVAGARRSA